MSSSTRLTDQEVEETELQAPPESVATHTNPIEIIHPPQDIRSIVEKTAQFVAKNGLVFEKRIIASNANNAQFAFLSRSSPFYAFYQLKLTEYRARNQDGAQPTDSDGTDLQPDAAAAAAATEEGGASETQPDLIN